MERLPTSLLDLLSIDLILRQTTPYLPISALLTLAATNKSLHFHDWKQIDAGDSFF